MVVAKRLAALATVSSGLVLVAAVVAVSFVYHDINTFFTHQLQELQAFDYYSKDAWNTLMAEIPKAHRPSGPALVTFLITETLSTITITEN